MTGLPWSAALEHLDRGDGAPRGAPVFWPSFRRLGEQVWLKAKVAGWLTVARCSAPSPRPNPFTCSRWDAAACTERLGVPGPWHARLPRFRFEFAPSSGREPQSGYFLPRRNAVDALAAMRALSDLMAPILQVAEISNVVAEDGLWLSGSYESDVIAIHCTWHPDEPADRTVLQQVESALLPMGARPHWGKPVPGSRRVLAAAYPRLTDFRDLAHRVGPGGKLHNPCLRRVLGI